MFTFPTQAARGDNDDNDENYENGDDEDGNNITGYISVLMFLSVNILHITVKF